MKTLKIIGTLALITALSPLAAEASRVQELECNFSPSAPLQAVKVMRTDAGQLVLEGLSNSGGSFDGGTISEAELDQREFDVSRKGEKIVRVRTHGLEWKIYYDGKIGSSSGFVDCAE